MSYNEDPENREQLKRSEVKEKERGRKDVNRERGRLAW